MSDLSDQEHDELPDILGRLEVGNYVIVSVAFVICVVAILGNSCVVYLVASNPRMRNVTNYFIASLAVSDIMIAVICIPFSFVANVLFDDWPFGGALCPVLSYFQVVVVFQNAYTILAMSFERYVSIVHPLIIRLEKGRSLQLVALCWILAFLTPIPTAVTSEVSFVKHDPNSTEGNWFCFEAWWSDHQRLTYSITLMVLQFFCPVVVLMFTYAKIVHVLWVKDTPASAELMGQNENIKDVGDNQEVDSRRKIIKMIITVVCIYILCWLPMHIFTIVLDIDSTLYNWIYVQIVWNSLQLVALSSCMYNPFIYWWMSLRFRAGYKIIFKRIKARIACQDPAFVEIMNMEKNPNIPHSSTNGAISDTTNVEQDGGDGSNEDEAVTSLMTTQ